MVRTLDLRSKQMTLMTVKTHLEVTYALLQLYPFFLYNLRTITLQVSSTIQF